MQWIRLKFNFQIRLCLFLVIYGHCNLQFSFFSHIPLSKSISSWLQNKKIKRKRFYELIWVFFVLVFVSVNISWIIKLWRGISREKKPIKIVWLWKRAKKIAYGSMSNKEFRVLWIFKVLLPCLALFASSFCFILQWKFHRFATKLIKVILCIRFCCSNKHPSTT